MPVPALDAKTVTALAEDATAAPSMHNAQPWRLRFSQDSRLFEVHLDPERAIPHTDPTSRALHIGCGAALFNLRVAVVHAGWEPATELLPDAGSPRLVAIVRLAGPAGAGHELAPLYPAIRRRHTSRFPFAETPLPQHVRDALRHAATREGAQLVFPGDWHVRLLLELVFDAEGRDTVDAARARELARWTHGDADAAREGVPESAFGPLRRDGRAPVRDFAGRRRVAGRESAVFEHTPQLALLGTREDRPRDWLVAGQAMERVLLQATLHGLATSLTSHPLEREELRRLVRDPRSAMGHVQMVMRLGYGPAGPATPRRPVGEVLTIE